MITYAWRDSLSDDEASEVLALAAAAAEYDDEAGFGRVVPATPEAGRLWPGTHQLLVRIQPLDGSEDGAEHWPLAAYLRLDVDDGAGLVQFVVRPEFRSLGVGTLTFEKLGVSPAGEKGWCDTGAMSLRAWAQGDHPAADRMCRRFGAERVHRMWQLVKPLTEPDDLPPHDANRGGIAVVAEHGLSAVEVAAAERVEREGISLGVSAGDQGHLLGDAEALVARVSSGDVVGVSRISTGLGNGSLRKAVGTVLTLAAAPDHDREPVGRLLLRAAVDRLRTRGIGSVQIYVDAQSDTVVRLTRELSFEHGRTDVCYQIR